MPPQVLPLLNDFYNVFLDDLPSGVLVHREVDHMNELKRGARPPYRLSHRLDHLEKVVVWKEITYLKLNRSKKDKGMA